MAEIENPYRWSKRIGKLSEEQAGKYNAEYDSQYHSKI